MQTIWIEIPVADTDRAARFYAAVFGHGPTEVVDDGTRRFTVLPGTPPVSLNRTAGFTPSADGALPYFHLDGGLDPVLARVAAAGGTVVQPGAERPGLGVFALVLDTEGNLLTLHSES